MRLAALSVAAMLAGTVAAASLDFEMYRKTVEPIFLKKRPGHARCVACHSANNSALHLQPVKDGQTAYTLEQSKQNFESVSQLVEPGKPLSSPLLLHPLSPEAGGDKFHGGGRQFASKNDPDWKAIAAWVTAAK